MNKSMGTLAIVLGLAAAADAQNIFITGSTAFRKQVFNSLGADMGLTVQYADTASSNSFTFTGTVSDPNSIGFSTGVSGIVGKSVTVFCTFSGSTEGVNTLVTPGQVITYTNLSSQSAFTFGLTNYPNGADLAFSDVSQLATVYASSPVQLNEILSADAISTGTYQGVAVQPFVWAANEQALLAGVTNMTPNIVQGLYANGTLGLSYWSGKASDYTTPVYAVGRTNDSGTRVTALADDYLNVNSTLSQYELSGNTWVSVGNNGYSSGGSVATSLQNNVAPAAVAYLGMADANNLSANGGLGGPISFQGTSPGAIGAWNLTQVENGQYTFWAYEHLYSNPSASAFTTGTFAPALVQALGYEIAHASPQTAILEGSMNVYRNQDGGPVSHF
ncbi:MAG: hypothetical protein ABSA47_15835 [Verrucomicrobiota bacterium]